MERSALAEAVIAEVGTLFMDAVRTAGPVLASADLEGVERQLQAVGRQVLGRLVEEVLAARAAAVPDEAPRCSRCGRPQRLVDRARVRQLQGLVGDYTVRRAYYHCAACHHGQAPFDAQVGLGAGALSPSLLRVGSRSGIEDGFDLAASSVGETLGLAVDDDTLWRGTAGLGAVAEADLQAAISQAQHGADIAPRVDTPLPAVLVVEVDGVHVRLRDGWHEMKVGRVAPLGPAQQTDRRSGRTHLALGPSLYCAGLEEAEAFWWRVHVTACWAGLSSRPLTVVVLGDGAEWIWARAAEFLRLEEAVTVVEIVDFYHVGQYLYEVAHAVFGQGAPQAAAWVEPLKDRLYTEGAAPVQAALDALLLQVEGTPAAETVRTARECFFTTHAARMNYPAFVAQQFPIGSGAIESTCKMLITAREKQAGMRWSAPGAQAVATLRALHRSGHWAAFWQTQPQRRRPPVCPHARARRAGPPPPVSAMPSAPPLRPAQRPARTAAPAAPPPTAPARAAHTAQRRRPAADHPWRHRAVLPRRSA
jgi:hypothetical protein